MIKMIMKDKTPVNPTALDQAYGIEWLLLILGIDLLRSNFQFPMRCKFSDWLDPYQGLDSEGLHNRPHRYQKLCRIFPTVNLGEVK